MKLTIKEIEVDHDLQLREALDMDRIKAMQEFEEQGGHLPPITVVGEGNLLADGFHRLEAADSMGRMDIEADRVPGTREDAIALAIQLNDIAVSKPLTAEQRAKGVEMLLRAKWSQERIASKTGVSQSTVANAATVLRMRGELTNIDKLKHAPTKDRAVLPREVHEQLDDTVLVRIASLDTVEEQAEMAAAVAAVPGGLSEPRVREAVKAVKAGVDVATAVDEATPGGHRMPATTSDVARDAYQRLDRFLTATMVVDGVERDFWQVLEVLVHRRDDLLDPTINTLADRLTTVAERADHFATALRSGSEMRKVSA